MYEDISEKKLNLIESNVDLLPNYIERLSKKRPEQFEIKQAEWTIKRNKINNILKQKSYFLFIGRFSSGKSSFVNALMEGYITHKFKTNDSGCYRGSFQGRRYDKRCSLLQRRPHGSKK